MIITIEQLKEKYRNYGDCYGKVSREVKSGTLFPLTKGLYETNRKTSGKYLSSYIYGPSYLSFEYALSYYGLIPEAVYTYTSASFNKKRERTTQMFLVIILTKISLKKFILMI